MKIIVKIILLFYAPTIFAQQNFTLLKKAGEKQSEISSEIHNNRGGCLGKNTRVSSPVREGKYAYKHELQHCANRAEVHMQKTKIGETYWQRWSMYVPKNYVNRSSGAHIFAQWAAYPKQKTTQLPCQGIGHYLALDRKTQKLMYVVQASSHKNGQGGGFCKQFPLQPLNAMTKGKWLDFVQYAKWTGQSDGFIQLWLRVEGGAYKKVMDYHGPTWWDDEGDGPYFKMGLYKGMDNWVGGGRRSAVIYTDFYELYHGKNINFKQIFK